MIRFRKLYRPKDDVDGIIELSAVISQLSCEMTAENKSDPKIYEDSSGGKIWLKDSLPPRQKYGSEFNAVALRQLPLYTLNFVVSNHTDGHGIESLQRMFTIMNPGSSVDEHLVSPIAVFHGSREGKATTWTLVTAGIIKTLSLNRALDTIDGGATDVSMTIWDLRLDMTFLQGVDVTKMNPDSMKNWKMTLPGGDAATASPGEEKNQTMSKPINKGIGV